MRESPPVTSPRLDWVDAGRGIAILLVAIYHGGRWLSRAGLETNDWQLTSTVVSSLRMPLFFTLSGLFARKWLFVSWRYLIRDKVFLFAWVFGIWEIIGSAAFVLGTSLDGRRVSLWDTAFSLLISPVVPRLELWFIWALALFFITAKIFRRVRPSVQLTISGACAAVALTVWLDQTTGVTGFLKYLFFFLAGLYLRNTVIRLGQARRGWMILAFGFWAVTSVTFAVTGLRLMPGVYFVNCVVGVLGGIALSRAVSAIGWVRWIGSQTLPIYLAHTPFIILESFVISKTMGVGGRLFGDVAVPVVAALAVIGSLLLHRWSTVRGLRYLYQPPPTLLRPLISVRLDADR